MKYCRCEKPTLEEVRATYGHVLGTICAKCHAPPRPPDPPPPAPCRAVHRNGFKCYGRTRDPSGLCTWHRNELRDLPDTIERMQKRLAMLRGDETDRRIPADAPSASTADAGS